MATREITDPTVRSDLNTSLAYNCKWPNKQDKMNQPGQWGPREEGLVCSSGHIGWNLVPRFPPPGLFSGLVDLFTASSLLPGNWAPRLSELQTLDPTESLPICVTRAGDLSLATPTPQFSPWEGSLPWAPEATEKNTGGPQSKTPRQWPSTHKASSCTSPEDTVPPWPNASVSSQAPKKQLVLSRQP